MSEQQVIDGKSAATFSASGSGGEGGAGAVATAAKALDGGLGAASGVSEGGLGAKFTGAESAGPAVESGDRPSSDAGATESRAGERAMADDIDESLETGTPAPNEMLQEIADGDKPTLLDQQRDKLNASRDLSQEELQAKVDAGEASIYDQRALSEKRKSGTEDASDTTGAEGTVDAGQKQSAEAPEEPEDKKGEGFKAAFKRGLSRLRNYVRRNANDAQQGEPTKDDQQGEQPQEEQASAETPGDSSQQDTPPANGETPTAQGEPDNDDGNDGAADTTQESSAATPPDEPEATSGPDTSQPQAESQDDNDSGDARKADGDEATEPKADTNGADGESDQSSDGENGQKADTDSAADDAGEQPDQQQNERADGADEAEDTSDQSHSEQADQQQNDDQESGDEANETKAEQQARAWKEIEDETQKKIKEYQDAHPDATIDQSLEDRIRMDVINEKYKTELEEAKLRADAGADVAEDIANQEKAMENVLRDKLGDENYDKLYHRDSSSSSETGDNDAEAEKLTPEQQLAKDLSEMGYDVNDKDFIELKRLLKEHDKDTVEALMKEIHEAKETVDLMVQAARDKGKEVDAEAHYQAAMKGVLEKYAKDNPKFAKTKAFLKLIGFLLWQMTRIGVEGTARIPVEMSKHTTVQ